MELPEMLTGKEMDTKTWSINDTGMVDWVEKLEDGVDFLNIEKEDILANQSIGDVGHILMPHCN
ncbi:hypothetical protein HAX54_036901, partial [Datura stramonium]|nr:hypothetical protein [Datura stramonium]